ncbi:MAG TPA: hypothetical protein VGN11_12050, partial [Candidatus Baltobacteraceae bacterium]|nr:hypothetical protein [Candidatus Baltobacteraceae bacterium]
MIECLSIEEWRSFDAEHPAPTFFARPAWALALEAVDSRLRAAPVRVALASGKTVLVPLVRDRGGALHWRDFCGFPLGAYTCFLLDNGELASADEAESALRLLRHRADVLTVVPWPLGTIPVVPFATARVHETAVIDLSNGMEAALAGVTGVSRRMAGQAARRGVVCAPDNTTNAVGLYYALLEQAAKRWGLARPSLSESLLEAVVRFGGRDVE